MYAMTAAICSSLNCPPKAGIFDRPMTMMSRTRSSFTGCPPVAVGGGIGFVADEAVLVVEVASGGLRRGESKLGVGHLGALGGRWRTVAAERKSERRGYEEGPDDFHAYSKVLSCLAPLGSAPCETGTGY
jgi:hypothetical protein